MKITELREKEQVLIKKLKESGLVLNFLESKQDVRGSEDSESQTINSGEPKNV